MKSILLLILTSALALGDASLVNGKGQGITDAAAFRTALNLPSLYQPLITEGSLAWGSLTGTTAGVKAAIAADPAGNRTAMQAAPIVHHVVVGDSNSSNGSGSALTSWAAYWSRLQTNSGVRFTNLAVGGRTAAEIDADHADDVTPISPDTLGGTGILFVAVGVNDLGILSSSAATVQGLLSSIWSKGRADGFRVVAFTIPKASTITAGEETARVALNTSIRAATSEWDALVDLDRIFPTYASGSPYYFDTIHFSAYGGEYISKQVKAVLDGAAILNSPVSWTAGVGTFSVPTGAGYTLVPYANPAITTDQMSALSGGTFTAPSDGWYIVNFSLAVQNASASIRWIIDIYKNGSSYQRVADLTSINYMISGLRIMKLSRGDAVSIRATHNHGSAITVNASNPASVLEIVKLNVHPD
jgi:hypothetical protein